MVNENYIEKINQTKTMLETFQKAKASILSKNDIAIMKNNMVAIKRSGWRKIAMVFGLSLEIVSIERTYQGKEIDNHLTVEARVRARDNLGRQQEEIGVCDWTEFANSKLKGTIHNITTKAVTRAYNRAISNMVGGGEVSAEEIDVTIEDTVGDINEVIEEPPKQTSETNIKKDKKEEKDDIIDNSSNQKGMDIEEMNKYMESF